MEKRTFIAIKIEPEKPLIGLISNLKGLFVHENLKWIEEFNLHITLHFIGETTLLQVKSIIEMLHSKTFDFPVFTLNLRGIDFFGSRNQPKVLIAKAEKNIELGQLVKDTAGGLSAIGLPGNLKSFSPHLTLARVKAIQNLPLFHAVATDYKDLFLQSCQVTEIIFYESILRPAGPVYKPIQIFKLKQTI